MLPRPAELELYLGDTEIYYRALNAEAQLVAAVRVLPLKIKR